MILDYIKQLDGNSWEELCHECYRLKYKNEHIQKIPANYGGDAGIEAFTRTGIVYQCYYPEKAYTDNELYEHLRDKLTTDVGKLFLDDNIKKYKSYGVPQIREWHFLIPEYRDPRILAHANTKKNEVIAKKRSNPKKNDHIHDSFDIIIKTPDDYKVEISFLLRGRTQDITIDLTINKNNEIDWEKCDAPQLDNIKRKVKAIRGDIEDEGYKFLVKHYAESYLLGIEHLEALRLTFPSIYHDVKKLEQQYKLDVEAKTKMNTDNSLHQQIFDKILEDFEEKLSSLGYFDIETILELKRCLISGWLAECSMEFR